MSVQPLTITATTPAGVVLSRPWGIALDGLLASVLWHREKWAARAAGNWLTYDHSQAPQLFELPLARCGDPGREPDWHWMATFADLHPHSAADSRPDVRWRTARTDRQRLQHLSASISARSVSSYSGRYQHRTIPVTAHPAAAATWRAVGDPDAIRELLDELPSIGKHRDVGEGVVTRWEVTPAPELDHWDAGHTHELGILGRTVPARCLAQRPDISTGAAGNAAIRPPYLHTESRTPAYHPAR